eukprot:31175-Alexandrium_andersonii.AAC.1
MNGGALVKCTPVAQERVFRLGVSRGLRGRLVGAECLSGVEVPVSCLLSWEGLWVRRGSTLGRAGAGTACARCD